MKEEGREQEISVELDKRKGQAIDKNLAYLEGSQLDDYLNDMALAQKFAVANRRQMAETIIEKMGWQAVDHFDSIHNYIDIENEVLRKGATDASKGQRLVIPLNMRDGSILAIGKGNSDWNASAPHGAGRRLSRTQAKEKIPFAEFQKSMQGIYSTSVLKSTLDEAPFAYKNSDSIIHNIGDTVKILNIIKPVYNFKGH